MEIELSYDSATVVRFFDPEGTVPVSASVALVAPSGGTTASPTVTLPSLSTVTTAATNTSLTLSSVTGLRQGSHLAVTSDLVTYVAEVARIDGLVVHLAAGLPLAVDVGSTVKHLDLEASIPSGQALGPNYRIIWTINGAQVQSIPASVVRWRWTPAVHAADVRSHMVAAFQDSKRSDSWCEAIATKANEQVKGALGAVQRRPYLYLSSQLFRQAALAAMRYELALQGIALGGQPYEAQRETRYAMDDALKSVLGSLAAYDTNNDGAIDANEAQPLGWTMMVVR